MKNTRGVVTLATMVFWGLTNCISAQYGYQLGIEGSPQLSWLLNKDDINSRRFNPESTINGSFGFMYEYELTKNTGIGVDAIYSMQGQYYQFLSMDFYKKVNYYKIPVMFCYTPQIGPGLRAIAKVGPQLGILSSAELLNREGKAIVKDQRTAYSSTDFGFVAMAGFGFGITSQLYADLLLRYDYSVTNAESPGYNSNVNNPSPPVLPNTIVGPATRAGSHNRTIGISVLLRYCYK